MKKIYFPALVAVLALTACVPQRLMEETKAKLTTCETESATAKKAAQDAEAQSAELKEKLAKEEKELAGLQRDTSILATNLHLLQNKYDKLNLVNDGF
jgi:uncharacterized protein HemX